MAASLGAARLKEIREKRGLTQLQLATMFEVDPGYIAKLEQGSRKPGRVLAVRLEEWSKGAVGMMAWDQPAKPRATPERKAS